MVPLIRDSVGVLLMRTPKDLDLELPGCYTRVGTFIFSHAVCVASHPAVCLGGAMV